MSQLLTEEVLLTLGFEHTGSPASAHYMRREEKDGDLLLYAFYASKPEVGQHFVVASRLCFEAEAVDRVIEMQMACSSLEDIRFFQHMVGKTFWRLHADPWEGHVGPLTRIAHEDP